MPLDRLIPMLQVRDVERAVAFYRDKLGFEVRRHLARADGTWYWCSLARDGVELMLDNLGGVAARRKHPDQVALYIYAPGEVDALHAELTQRGVDVQDVSIRFYGMKEFHATDPDGHQLCFGEATEKPSEEPTPQ